MWSSDTNAQTPVSPPVSIELVPMGDVDSSLIRWMARNLTRVYGIRVVVGQPALLPKEVYNSRRKQYDADRLASLLVKRLKGMVWRVLGAVNQDLYAEHLDFVFGSANPALGVAIVSLTRLDDIYYGLPPNQVRFRSRAIKESVRFLGLSMGMKPLDDPQCIMSPSRRIEDIDRKIPRFCPPSREHLQRALKALRRMQMQ